jgi:ArsR family transcriptional regulator, virulence genes transcriptional regulator
MENRRQPRAAPRPDLSRLAEMHEHAGEAAALMKTLGNEQRLLILCNLLEGPLSVSELNERVQLSQSALSQHLALLREQHLVETRREAQSIYYSLPPGPVTQVMALLQDLYCSTPAARPGSARPGKTRSGRQSVC